MTYTFSIIRILFGDRRLVMAYSGGYRQRLEPLLQDVTLAEETSGKYDVVQVFVKKRKELEGQLPQLKPALKPNGILWAIYPKKTSKGFVSDLDRDMIREYAVSIDLEAVAIFSVDEDCSVLRLSLP